MSYRDNTATKLQAITDSMLSGEHAIDDSMLNNTVEQDKDRIIRELVAHVRKQHSVIRSLNEKLNPDERVVKNKTDKFADFIESEVQYEDLNAQKKDKLIGRLSNHIGSKQDQLKKSIGKLSNVINASSGSDKVEKSETKPAVGALSVEQRREIEEEIKAELLTQIKDDLRKELLAEIHKQTESISPQRKVRTQKDSLKSEQASRKEEMLEKQLQEKELQARKITEQRAKARAAAAAKLKSKEVSDTARATQTFSEPASEVVKPETAKKAPAQKTIAGNRKAVEAKKARQSKKAVDPLAAPSDEEKLQASIAQFEQSLIDEEPAYKKPAAKSENLSWPLNGAPLKIEDKEDDEEDKENDEIDSEQLYSLTDILHTSKLKSPVDHSAPSLIEVTRLHHGEVRDLQHIAVGSSYTASVGDRALKIASNGKNNQCQVHYQQNTFKGAVGDYHCKTSGESSVKSLQSNSNKKLIKYTLPPDKVVFLKAGNDEYRLRVVPTSIPVNVPEPQRESKKGFRHYISYSAAFHFAALLLVSLFVWVGNVTKEEKEEPRFAQVDLEQLNQVKPTPVPTPKPTPAPKPKPKPKSKSEKPKPVKTKVKTTTKPASPKPKPKNAGGGSKEGGNVKKRDVKSSGLLAALGTKKGKKPGQKQALATISSIDAVSTLNKDAATLKVGGLAAKVKGARIEVATGELIDTKGSTKVLRSGGAEGDGQIAALETGVTGNRDVRGKVSASLTRKVKIQGGLSRDEVKRVIDAHMDEVVYCYEKTLLSTPGLAGKAVFEWKVLLSGRVGEVNIKSSSLRSSEIHSCIKSAIKSWQFPQPTGTSVFVSYPFIFDSVEF